MLVLSALIMETFPCKVLMKLLIYTHYFNNNLTWRAVSCPADEAIPSDHPRREASRVIQRYGLIHET